MKIVKTILPESSLLSKENSRYDYVDSFQAVFTDNKGVVSIEKVGKAFFTSAPKWVGSLMSFRDRIVAFFGLKTSGTRREREKQLEFFNCEPGEQLGLFKVFSRSNQEVVLGENDSHLSFRISLFLDSDQLKPHTRSIILSTSVVFHNKYGRLYFIPVRPFHKLIVPVMLKGIVKELEKE